MHFDVLSFKSLRGLLDRAVSLGEKGNMVNGSHLKSKLHLPLVIISRFPLAYTNVSENARYIWIVLNFFAQNNIEGKTADVLPSLI